MDISPQEEILMTLLLIKRLSFDLLFEEQVTHLRSARY